MAFDAGLDQLVCFRRRPLEEVGLARERGRLHPVGADAELLKRPLEAWDDPEDADRAGDGRGLGIDEVARRRDPIAARCGDAAHRNDNRDLSRLGLEQRLADPLRCEHRAARAVDPDDQRLDALVADSVFDFFGDRVAARRSGARLAVDDHAGDGDDADRPGRFLVDDIGDIGGEL